jgi:hypothetical protein
VLERSAAARQVVESFFRHIDDEEPLKVSALFAEDGIWQRREEAFKGPAEVLKSLTENPPLMPTCHLTTNFLFTTLSPDEAQVVFYVTAYRSAGGLSKCTRPMPMDVPVVLSLYKAVLVLVDNQWRIKKIESEAIFRRQ